MKVNKEWLQLRFAKHNHLGLGDIRLTTGQQEEILAALADAKEGSRRYERWLKEQIAEKESLAHDRGVIIDSQLEQIASDQYQIAALQTKVKELEAFLDGQKKAQKEGRDE
jgi:predicted phage-related endonuclease